MATNKNTSKTRQIRLTGADGQTVDLKVKKDGYDLDAIASADTRNDSSKPFVAHIKLYNPNSVNKEARSVIPEDVKIGSMWIARRDGSL